jgi:ComF family protein
MRERFFRAVVDLVLPTRCLACDSRAVREIRSGGVCRPCWAALPALSPERCPICDEPTPGSAFDALACGRCVLDPPPFRLLRSAVPYRGTARAVLIAFKFRGADFLASHLAGAMRAAIPAPGEPYDEIVPVPATAPSRWRRDHPAELLAHAVARTLGATFAPRRLVKVRATAKQSGLPARERRRNVRGAFSARGAAPERVLLVDDVATSGATARECASALRRSGARHVDVWCFARATREDEIAEQGSLGHPAADAEEPSEEPSRSRLSRADP